MSLNRAIELQERAWNLQAEGNLEEALIACREALSLLEKSEGPESPDVANLLNDLAEIENDRRDFQSALALGERARSIEDALGDRFVGPDAARIRGRTLGLLGMIRCDQGDYASADGDLQIALAVAVAEFGEASEEAAERRNNLAVLYKHWGRFDRGLELYTEALPCIVAAHGEESLATATIYHNIGGILHSQGNFAAAEAPAEKAWKISRHLLGEDDPRAMLDGAAYAVILDGLKRYKESETIYRQALGIFERTFGPQHYEVATNLHNLAAALTAQGQYGEAERHYRRALTIKESQLGAESPDVALTRNNLGSLLNDQGQPAEALPLLENAVAILDKRLTAGHPYLVAARNNLQNANRLIADQAKKDRCASS
jgi:tetratricopeptide (TPR) repeat protein